MKSVFKSHNLLTPNNDLNMDKFATYFDKYSNLDSPEPSPKSGDRKSYEECEILSYLNNVINKNSCNEMPLIFKRKQFGEETMKDERTKRILERELEELRGKAYDIKMVLNI